MRISRAAALVMIPLVGATTACDIGGPDDDARLSLSFAVQPRVGLAGMAAGSWTPSLLVGANTLTLSTVELDVDEVVLERSEADGADSDRDSEDDSDSDGGDNQKLVVNGATVALPLAGGVITPFTATVPVGLYEELELDLNTIRLVGVVDGTPFDVTVPMDLELDLEFDPPIQVVDANAPFNVTVSIDPLIWLRKFDGTFIDPRQLATDRSLRSLVRQRIALTFAAFEDSDRDGDDHDSDSDRDSDSDGNRGPG